MDTSEIANAVQDRLAEPDAAENRMLPSQRRLSMTMVAHGLNPDDTLSFAREPIENATPQERYEIQIACEREIARVIAGR